MVEIRRHKLTVIWTDRASVKLKSRVVGAHTPYSKTSDTDKLREFATRSTVSDARTSMCTCGGVIGDVRMLLFSGGLMRAAQVCMSQRCLLLPEVYA